MEFYKQINNITKVRNLLDFSEPNTCYILQVMKRKKDDPTMQEQRKMLKVYYIYSLKDFDDITSTESESGFVFHQLVNSNRARAYLVLNKRITGDAFAFDMIKWVSEYAKNKQYSHLRNVFDKAVGQDQKVNYWLLDVDNIESYVRIMEYMHLHPKEGDKQRQSMYIEVVEILKTFSGWHIIVKPFNPTEYNRFMSTSFEKMDFDAPFTDAGGQIVKYCNVLLLASRVELEIPAAKIQ